MAGIIGSVMNLFHPQGGATIQGQPAPAPNPAPTKNNTPNQPLPGSDPTNPMIPNNPALAGATDSTPKVEDPLDKLKDIWTNPVVDKDAPIAPTIDGIFASVDPKKIMEQAGTIDFAKTVTPEILEKINKGGPEAMTAMLQAMNTVGQQAFGQAALASVKITKEAISKASEINRADYAGQIKRQNANEALVKANEAYAKPAMAPIVGALQEQFIKKNPNATADEIKTQVVDALQVYGEVLNPTKKDTGEKPGSKESTDWSLFG